MSDAGPEHGGHGQHGGAAHPTKGKHGMLVVGLDAIFVSHLAMVHAPHDFQPLAEVELEDAEPHGQDRRTSAEPIYTLDPEPFSWKELLSDGSEPPRRTSFKADVYRGHFERGGTQIIEQARVKVRSVDFSTELLSADPASEDLTYRGLGQGDELFMAHEIRGAPNFDHVLSFRFVDPAFAEMQLTGAPVVIPGRADATDDRLRSAETVTALFPQTIGPTGQHGFSTQIGILDEIYLEIGELKE